MIIEYTPVELEVAGCPDIELAVDDWGDVALDAAMEVELAVDDGGDVALEVAGRQEVELAVDDGGDVALDVAMEVVNGASEHPYYDGEYSVIPSFDEQEFDTEGKVMRENVTVTPIIVSSTANLAGGNTIYIGGIIADG